MKKTSKPDPKKTALLSWPKNSFPVFQKKLLFRLHQTHK
jgi:hypothetical protein